jgi:hypothetical protein
MGPRGVHGSAAVSFEYLNEQLARLLGSAIPLNAGSSIGASRLVVLARVLLYQLE